MLQHLFNAVRESQTDSDWVHWSKLKNKGSMLMKPLRLLQYLTAFGIFCGVFFVIFYKQLSLVMPQERLLVEQCKIDVVYVTEESEAQK